MTHSSSGEVFAKMALIAKQSPQALLSLSDGVCDADIVF